MYPGTIMNIDTRFLDTPIIYIGLFILFLWSPSTDWWLKLDFLFIISFVAKLSLILYYNQNGRDTHKFSQPFGYFIN